MRGLALPSQPLRETPFVVTAPKADTSTKSEYSMPAANVPEAVVTGFFIVRPPRFTARLTPVSRGVFAAITTPPPGHRRRGRQRRSASCRERFPQRRKGKLRHRTPCASPSTPGKDDVRLRRLAGNNLHERLRTANSQVIEGLPTRVRLVDLRLPQARCRSPHAQTCRRRWRTEARSRHNSQRWKARARSVRGTRAQPRFGRRAPR